MSQPYNLRWCLFERRSMKAFYVASVATTLSFILVIYCLYMDQIACYVSDEFWLTSTGEVFCSCGVDNEPPCSAPLLLADSITAPTSFTLMTNSTLYSTCTLDVTLTENILDQSSSSCCGQKESDLLYSNQLTVNDMSFYDNCLNHTRWKMKSIQTGKCCFMDGSKRATVALVSHPGSGNTWVRGLLEKATGVCTGSVYCDEELRGGGMRGESVRSGAVIVTKTHLMNPNWTDINTPGHYENLTDVPLYGSAILLIRNPYDAFVAERSRLVALLKHQPSHIAVANHHKYFGRNRFWNWYVRDQIKQWSRYFIAWLVDGIIRGRPVHVVKFEHLKSDPLKEVKGMLDFLHFDYEEEELRARIATDFSTFQRRHKNDDFDHYTAAQRLYIDTVIKGTIECLYQLNITSDLELKQYLWHSS